MSRSLLSFVVAVAAFSLTGLSAVPSYAANVTGVISEASGKPVPGVTVTVENQAGKVLQAAVSGKHGSFAIKGLNPDSYRFMLNLDKSGFKNGAPVVAFVSGKGLVVNWMVSASAAPIAVAHPGSDVQLAAGDPFGMTWQQFLLLGGAVVAGGTVGGVAAAGGFSGGSGNVASASK